MTGKSKSNLDLSPCLDGALRKEVREGYAIISVLSLRSMDEFLLLSWLGASSIASLKESLAFIILLESDEVAFS